MDLKNTRGLTLIELVIAIAVMAIIALIAIPSYQSSLVKSRRGDAMGALSQFATAMERYHTEHYSYTGAATGGQNTGTPTIFPSKVPVDGAKTYYNLTITAASKKAFTLRATPVDSQAEDGYLEIDSTGLRRWDKNNNTTIESSELEW